MELPCKLHIRLWVEVRLVKKQTIKGKVSDKGRIMSKGMENKRNFNASFHRSRCCSIYLEHKLGDEAKFRIR